MNNKTINNSKPWWLIAAPVLFLLLWSGGYVVAKVGLAYAPPLTLLALRFTCVIGLMAILFALFRPELPKTAKDWGHVAMVGFLMQSLYFGMTYIAFINGIAAGTAALIMSVQPILVAIVAPSWTGEQVSRKQWGGLTFALAGTAVVIFTRSEIGPARTRFILRSTCVDRNDYRYIVGKAIWTFASPNY